MSNFFGDNGNNASVGAFSTNYSSIDVRPLMRMVYMWMSLGLLTTALISGGLTIWAINSATPEQLGMLFTLAIPLGIFTFIIVMALSWGINRMSPAVATGAFFFYAALNGVTFSALFFAYIANGAGFAILNAFLTTAGLFGAMTVIGYTTKVDLSKYSTYFMMGLIGLLIAMVVNIFLNSGALGFIISVVGVILFTALTAYDTQKIKEMAAQPAFQDGTSEATQKMAIMGALTLYLDFINLFLFLLQLFAGGRD